MGINLSAFCLNKSSGTPLYMQLKQFLMEEMTNRSLQEGDALPTELELAEKLSISRATVRHAFDSLESEGYLKRKKGCGTLIQKPKIDEGFFQVIDSFNNEMRQKGFTPKTNVLELKKTLPNAGINEKLKLDSSEPLILLSRLRYANDEPIVYVDTYLPLKYFVKTEKGLDILNGNFETESLYSVLEEKYGFRILHAERVIEAVAANSKEAKLLNINLSAPVCLVKTIAFAQNEIPIEYSIARYRGDRNKFKVELKR